MVMHRFDLDTGGTKEKNIPFLNKSGTALNDFDYIIGNKIFRNENGRFFMMNLNGENAKKF